MPAKLDNQQGLHFFNNIEILPTNRASKCTENTRAEQKRKNEKSKNDLDGDLDRNLGINYMLHW